MTTLAVLFIIFAVVQGTFARLDKYVAVGIVNVFMLVIGIALSVWVILP